MGDVNDCDAFFFKAANGREEFFDLVLSEGSRRLVHDQNSGVQRKRLSHFDHLLFSHSELFHQLAWIESQTQEPLRRASPVGRLRADQ